MPGTTLSRYIGFAKSITVTKPGMATHDGIHFPSETRPHLCRRQFRGRNSPLAVKAPTHTCTTVLFGPMGFSPRACALRHHRCPVGRPTAQCRHMQRPMLTITWRPPVSVTRQVNDAHPASLPSTAGRKLVLYGNVPRRALYQAFHTSQEESARNSLRSMESKGSSMLVYTPSPL